MLRRTPRTARPTPSPTRAPAAALAALVAASTLVVPVAAAGPAAADHTDLPQSVTLVGSLQDELGCESDWRPACEATGLRPVDGPGSTTYDAVFTVPAGSYELKVALDGSWEESYGGGGDGSANLPLHLEHAASLRFGYDHVTHAVAFAPAEQPSGEVTPADERLAGTSLRQPTSRENFYFVMADRFANGDPGNDTGGLEGDRLTTGLDPEDKGFYHGGDIAGLTEKLDYIEGLGTSAIWLTPSFRNRPVQGTGENASAGYHGYWITDFTRIDPHFGTNAELEAFIDKAHARGIKVFFDIITNHTADVVDYEEQRYSYVSKETSPYRDASGTEFDDADHAGQDSFPELDAETSFPYTPVFRTDADRTVKEPAWLNDPTNYHNRGDSTFAGESSTYGDFVGLDDLFTEKPEVVDGMTDIYKSWVDFGIDGFRIDTVKHVNMEFWQEFAPAIAEEARRVGNDDFFAFGEVYEADPKVMSTYTTTGRLDATLDFGFQSAGVGFAQGRPTTGLRDFFAGDDYYTDTDSNAYAAPTFLGNHDMGRVGTFLAGGAGGDELLRRDRLAHTLMYLTRGQPVVYYGDEQGFTGDGGDKDARQDMFPSRVPSYNDDDLIGTDATTAEANFDTAHPLYRRIADLAALRERYPALADGAQLHRYASGRAGIYAFSRISPEENREYVVAVNNATTEQRASFDTLMRAGHVQAGVAGHRHLHQVRPRGPARRHRPTAVGGRAARGRHRRRARRPRPPRTSARPPPAAPSAVARRSAVSVPEGGFNQVSIAWRHAGADRLDPARHRRQRPLPRLPRRSSGLPQGTLLEYRAVLRDSSGNLSVASTYATVGKPASGGGGGGDTGGGGPGHPALRGLHARLAQLRDRLRRGLDARLRPGADVPRPGATRSGRPPSTLPAGTYEYKAAIDRGWDENYGAGGAPGGANIPLDAAGADTVTFYYDHATHYVTTDAEGPIVTAAGSFQDELGCPATGPPSCMAAWLKDPDGDGTFTFTTTRLPAGSYQVKATHGLSWDENYGAGGAPGGANIDFDVPPDGVQVVFSYDVASHVLTVSSRAAGASPDLSKPKAQWLREGLVAWDVSDPAARRYRLHWSPAGRPRGRRRGGHRRLESGAADLRPAGSAGRRARRLPAPRGLRGVPARRPGPQAGPGDPPRPARRRRRTTRRGCSSTPPGCRSRASSTTCTRRGRDRDLGVTWARGRPVPRAVGADRPGRRRLLVWRRRRRARAGPDGPPAGRLLDRRRPRRVEGRLLPLRRRRSTRRPPAGSSQPGHRPLLGGADHQLRTVVLADLDDPALAPAGWSSVRAPRDRPGRGPQRLRAARARLLHRRRDRARRGARHLPRLHPRRVRRDAPPAHARGGGAQHRAPAAGLRHRHHRGASRRAGRPGVRPRRRTRRLDRSSRPASTRSAAQDGFNWGYDPLHYTGAGGLLRHRPGGHAAHPGVPRDGPGPQRRRPPGGHGRGLQPHRGLGPGREVGARQGGARLLPPALGDRVRSRPRPAARTPRPSTR